MIERTKMSSQPIKHTYSFKKQRSVTASDTQMWVSSVDFLGELGFRLTRLISMKGVELHYEEKDIRLK